MTNLVVIAATSSMNRGVYLKKLQKILKEAEVDYAFWGWDREGRESNSEESDTATRVLLKGGGYSNKCLLWFYPLWMIRVFAAVLSHGRNAKYFCVNFETAFPVALVSLIKRVDFIFAELDNLSLSHKWPAVAKRIILAAERFSARRATIHLLPSVSRVLGTPNSNVRIVANTPLSSTVREAQVIARRRSYTPRDPLTVYVNGWLTTTRGLDMIKNALLRCPEVHCIVAGTPQSEAAKQLIELPNAEYLGSLSDVEALAAYYMCHVALAFYDPSIEINRIAEPNKWMDCMSTGTPFITNLGIVTAEPFLTKQVCFAIPYGDENALVEVLKMLARDKTIIFSMKENIAKIGTPPPWDHAMMQVLREWG